MRFFRIKKAGLLRKFLAALLALLMTATGLLVAAPNPVSAYNVCIPEDNHACVHEYMADQALNLVQGRLPSPELQLFMNDVRTGATHEDQHDHMNALSALGGGLITITHFWDADNGDNDPVEVTPTLLGNIPSLVSLGSYPNAWQKVQSLWSMALGAYAKGDKHQAYHMLGHVVHLIGDATIPTHAHDDMHGPDDLEDDAYEEWMSSKNPYSDAQAPARLSDSEREMLMLAGPITAPPDQPDKLLWLLYQQNQIADFFASDNVDGDAVDPRGWVQERLDQMSASISRPRVQGDLRNPLGFGNNDDGNNDDDGDLSIIRAHSYLRGIQSIAGLYMLFEETVSRQINLAVVIDHVEEDEDHDYGCVFDVCVKVTDPDFYARVAIDGRQARNRGDQIVNDNVIDPGWSFGAPVSRTGSVPVNVQIWDSDGAGESEITTGGGDDQSDINPAGGLDLNLQVDIAKCLLRQPGAVTGDVSGSCGETFTRTGERDHEASQVRFRIIMSKSPPVANPGGPYQTNEGVNVSLNGNGSTDPDNDITAYAWDLDGDGACDDVANDATPDFTAVGQDGTTAVKLCVTDSTGLTDEATTTVTVHNAVPAVSVQANTPAGENTQIKVTGMVTDPGWLDPLTTTINWGDGSPAQPLSGILENSRPDATLAFEATHVYGDNGTFTVTVCAKDDDTETCRSSPLTIGNTNPDVAIDLSGAVTVNGVPTVIAHAGTAVAFNGRVTDPGSDDLTLAWNWGDGNPAASSTSLVNPPVSDPAVSPTIQPRDITFPQMHSYSAACTYQASFTAADDDSGSTESKVNVIILGNGDNSKGHGYWKNQLRPYAVGEGKSDFDAATLGCYLKVVGYMSRVFDERTDASTFANTYELLENNGDNSAKDRFDLQLLTVWLDFANGAVEYDRLVDTDGDKRPDAPFLTAMAMAEDVRLDPNSTPQQLDRLKADVERWSKQP